jgi:ligand-binding sensor domain-containing protein
MTKNLFSRILFACFLLLSTAGYAQDFEFQALKGLNGGNILCLEKADTLHLFAGTTTGIYSSSNGGQLWKKELDGLNIYKIKAYSPEIIYAGTNKGLYRRNRYNMEYRWDKITGFTDQAITDLDILSSGVMFVSGKNTGLYKGTIQDNHFSLVTTLEFFSYEYSIACYGDSTVFIDNALSSDAGESWTKLENGWPQFRSLTVLKADMIDSLVLAGTDNGIFRYDFTKQTWIDLKLYQHCLDLDIDGKGNIFLSSAGGVYRSSDRGDHWQQINLGLSSAVVQSIRIAGLKVFAGSNYGLDFMHLNDTQWTASDTGITDVSVYSILPLPDNLLISSSLGVISTADDGQSWHNTTRMDYHFDFTDHVHHFAVAPNGKLYACTSTGLYYSTDETHWFTYGGNIGQQIYDLTFDKGGNLFKATGDGVYKSANEAMTWTKLNENDNLGTTTCLVLDNDNHLYVGTSSGIFETDDNGAHWEDISGDSLNNTYFQRLVFRNNIIYAATSKGVYIYDLLYKHWTKSDVGIDSPFIMDLNFGPDNLLFAASYSGIYASSDSGLVWRALAQDEGTLHDNCLAFDQEGNIYFGTNDNGLYTSKRSLTSIYTLKSNNLVMRCFPTPFKSAITVSFNLPDLGAKENLPTSIALLDEQGKVIPLLKKTSLKSGTHTFHFNLNQFHLPKAIFFIRLNMGEISKTQKVIHLE